MTGRLPLLTLLLLAASGCPPQRRRSPTRSLDAGPVAAPTDVGFDVVIEASIPIPPGTNQSCASDADCPGGFCFTPGMEAQFSRVFRDCPDGQAWRATHRLNTCFRAACQTDTECPAGTRCADIQMLPFPQRACVPATCHTMWDCRRGRMGQCREYVSGRQCSVGGWACSYPADPCAPQDYARLCPPHAGMIARCVPRNGRFGCVYEPPPSP